MKNNKYVSLAFIAGSLLAGGCFTSCQQDAVSELNNTIKVPQQVKMVSASGLQKIGDIVDGKRTFKLGLTTDKGDNFDVTFISGKYYLSGGSYTLSSATTVKDANAGSYLKGATVNGVEIMDGSFNLNATPTADGKYAYSINECYIFDTNGNSYAISASDVLGTFEFTPDAADEVTMCNNVNKMEEGYLTLELITVGYECDESGWPPVYTGTGGINWTIKFVSANGRLEAGDYQPGKDYVVGSAAFLSGDLCEMYGFGFNQDCSWGGGTCVSTYSGVAGKCPDRTNLTASTIHVERDGDMYHIYTDPTAEAWIEFSAEIPEINPDSKLGEDYTFEKVYSATNEAIKGAGLHYIDLALSLGNVAAGATEGTYTGTGRILNMRLQSEAGKVATGAYTLVDTYEEFGLNTWLSTSSSLIIVQDGDVTQSSLNGAKLSVSEKDGLYTINIKAGEDTYTYVGDLSELDPKISFTTCTKVVDGNVATLTFSTEGWPYVAGAQLILQVYTEDGDIKTGTYGCAHMYLGTEFGPMMYKGTEFDATYQVTGGSILYTFDGAAYNAPWLLGPELNIVNFGDYGYAGYYSMETVIDNKTYNFMGAITAE